MKITQPYSKKVSLKTLDYLQIDLTLSDTSQPIPLEELFETAIRKNKKRWFLFVSRILGKHLAVETEISLIGGILLAYAYKGWPLDEAAALLGKKPVDEACFKRLWQKKVPLKKKVLFIGFAETATGLGHSMFSMCEGSLSYIHTTRERIISEEPVFTFQEVHSHAAGHQCFSDQKDFFSQFEEIVLVDDEITTGHTALHLIEALKEKCSARRYTVVSLLDWRSSTEKAEAQALAQGSGLEITFVSLVQGEMEFKLLKPVPEELLAMPQPQEIKGDELPLSHTVQVDVGPLVVKETRGEDGKLRDLAYMRGNGRFGITSVENRKEEDVLRKVGSKLKAMRQYERCLVIGTEEYIYIPCFLAMCMGEHVKYQSSTRSPIIAQDREGYPIKDRITFRRPEDHKVLNYLYNITKDAYDEIFWILERDVEEVFKQYMTAIFEERGIKRVTFVACDGYRG